MFNERTDEDGNRFATWTYDQLGRGLTSQHGGGDAVSLPCRDGDAVDEDRESRLAGFSEPSKH